MAVRGRHKARNPWEYRACASGPARVLHELWGGLPTLLSPVFFFPFFLSRFFLFLIWDSVTWRIHGYLNHVARESGWFALVFRACQPPLVAARGRRVAHFERR